MKKQVLEIIAQKSKDVNKYIENHGFTWKQVQEFLKEKDITLQDDDLLEVGFQDFEQSHEDDYTDACYFIKVRRWREYTEEEKRKWKEDLEEMKEQSKKKRYQNYLELKKEFEND